MAQVGVRPELAMADVNAAIARLATLNNCVTPLSKLCLLAEVHDLLIAALDDNFRAADLDPTLLLSPTSGKPKVRLKTDLSLRVTPLPSL
jgi:hypothetical protein